ncbi:MAG: bifunctional diaminohydroxyphosphoribosylaminopyrimidine deaminase/5-amino-6-(5-phosphoribosylamino)uracil reductase RibD [Pseudomonadota bacterium]
MDQDLRWMQLALSLGRRGLGQVWPNPAVGCVLVQGARIVGRGWTQPGGRPHAEVEALAQAGPEARGSTAYVTLEPCSHTGQTPPCAQALIEAGVSRVVIAAQDPDPRVSGRGLEMLRQAGIEVSLGPGEPQARCDHAGFLSRINRGRPILTLKLAGSLDARIATATGESQWITGSAARRLVHAMRARHDAVLVGGGTARTDMPSLTVRDMGKWSDPVRIVASTSLNLPRSGPLFETASEVPVWVLHGQEAPQSAWEAWRAQGAQLLEVETGADGQLDMVKCLSALAEAGLTRVFCEGGSGLATSVLRSDLVDELIVFTAGIALGGTGSPALADLGVATLGQAPRFELYELTEIGGDVMSVWKRRA